jgi:Fe-S cluster biosynthesis and repair protein YggX
MKKTLLILSLIVTVVIVIGIAFNAKKIYIFSYAFVKEKILTTVPNYSNERGFDIVSKEEYEKYQQGYCLNENRILSFEEKYRRALEQYLDKSLEFNKLYYAEWCWTHADKNCRFNTEDDIKEGIDVTPEAVEYYELNDNLTLSNWFEVLSEVCKEGCNFDSKKYRSFFFNELNATKTDPKQYLIINKDDMTAGFSRPIIMHHGYYYYKIFYLFLDKSYILYNDSSALSTNRIYIFESQATNEYDKTAYERKLKERNYKGTAIDNCGNIDFSVKKVFEESKESMNKGG